MIRRALIASLRDERGATLSEYALVLAVAGIVMLGSFALVNAAAGQQYDTTSHALTDQGRTPP